MEAEDSCCSIAAADVDNWGLRVQGLDCIDKCGFCCVCHVVLESSFSAHNIAFLTSYI